MPIGGPTPEVDHVVTNGAAVTVVQNASDSPTHSNGDTPRDNTSSVAKSHRFSFADDSSNPNIRISNGHANSNTNTNTIPILDPSQQQNIHLVQQQQQLHPNLQNLPPPSHNPVMALSSSFDGLAVATPSGPPTGNTASANNALGPQLLHHPHAHPLPHLAHQHHHLLHAHAHAHTGSAPAPHHPHAQHHPLPHMLPPTTMQMWVPQERVGAVIGSQGAVIRSLQDRSRATIQVHNETIRGDCKLFTIVGGPQECQVARQLVTEIIERHRHNNHNSHHNNNGANSSNGNISPNSNNMNQQQSNRGGDRPYGEDNSSKEHNSNRSVRLSKTVYVPTTCVGLVIGRGGETIRDLQAKSNASIFVTRDRDAAHGSRERSVTISGTEQAINAAEMLVKQIVREAHVRRHNNMAQGGPGGNRSNNNNMMGNNNLLGPMQMETLTVPDDKVGLIIGKGGAAIRELQSISGAKIQVAKEDEVSASSNTRPVTITGMRSCIETARALIAEKVNMHLPPNTGMVNLINNNNGNANVNNNGGMAPQQGGYPAAHNNNPPIYYPMYETAGFPHGMQAPYQHAQHHHIAHGHPQGHPQVQGMAHMDPINNSEQMRAAMQAHYQYYFGFPQHAQVMHQMAMQQHPGGGGESQDNNNMAAASIGEQVEIPQHQHNNNETNNNNTAMEAHITQSASEDTITISMAVGDTVQGLEEGGSEANTKSNTNITTQQQHNNNNIVVHSHAIQQQQRRRAATHGHPNTNNSNRMHPQQQQLAHHQMVQMAQMRAAQMHHHQQQQQNIQQQVLVGNTTTDEAQNNNIQHRNGKGNNISGGDDATSGAKAEEGAAV